MNDSLKHLAQKHYENFPVGSRIVPRRYREPIHLIYTFARVADDIADEGHLNEQERIQRLNEWEQLLFRSVDGGPSDDFFKNLAAVIRQFHLPVRYFQDLIVAFRRDTSNPIYPTFDRLLDYCRYSANPIGRLMLTLFDCSSDENELYSDKICTALQLTNFWQDISVDTRRNRFYIAIEDLDRFGLTFSDLMRNEEQDKFCHMMKFQVERTRGLFEEGSPLISKVSSEFRKELYFIYLGGSKILDKIEALDFDTRSVRPSLSTLDMFSLAVKSFIS